MHFKRSKKVKTLPTKTTDNLSSKDGIIFVSNTLFQRLVILATGCNMSFGDYK